MASCKKPEPEAPKVIEVSSSSRTIVSQGLSVDGAVTVSETFAFTAPDSWTASVTDTKASAWVTLQPSSGPAGNVVMTVTAKANDTFADREAKVTITSGTASVSFTVRQSAKIPPVESVRIVPDDIALIEGTSTQVTAVVEPAQANQDVTWASDDETVATVDGNGNITAVKEGTTFVTATAEGKKGVCKVHVEMKVIPAEYIALDQSQITIKEGESRTLQATIYPPEATERTVTWTSDFPEVATVDAHGTVTGVQNGSTSVIARCGEAVASCVVYVDPSTIPVESVSLNMTALTLDVGGTDRLLATVRPDNATDKTVTWTSQHPEVATVDADGKVTAVAAGITTITAKAGDAAAICVVTVNMVPVISVSLNKTELVLIIGASETLTATVLPENATDKTVTWTSSDTSKATVDSNGKVTAVAKGTATITAQAGDSSATCNVTVNPVPVASVTLNKTELTLLIGASETLTATVSPDNAEDKTVTWTSSNTSKATVDSNGKVTAVAIGSATITATAGGKSATCTVTVNPVPVTSVTLSKDNLTLQVGASETLTATVAPDNATYKTVTWTSSDTSKATVDNNGKVTAVAVGTATITATADGKSATCAVTVNPVPVTSVTLSKDNLTLQVGASETLTATVAPDNATYKTVTWDSSDTSKATVDANGKVTAVAVGTATITATADGKSATCTVTVNPVPVTSVTLSKDNLTLQIGTSETLTATVVPDNATYKTVSWSSSDLSKVTVDNNGKVTAVAVGSATITATADGKSATCTVTVPNPSGGFEGTGEQEW